MNTTYYEIFMDSLPVARVCVFIVM